MKTSSPQEPLNPFPGLRPFRSDEHHLFFGREEQTAALLQLLRTNRFLAVVGTSGSGKSSLVRAGMIAALHGGTMTQAGSTWEVMILRPGGSPIENLARAIVEADLYDAEDPSTLPRLLATLNRSRFGLVEAMKQCEILEPGTNVLVVVDQFEELFRFRQQGVDSEETAAAFVNLLLTASEQAECPIYITITMRSDYLGDCSEIPGLAEAVNDGEYLIPRLLRDQKRDAIEKPIGVGGARISPMLVQRLLNDVGDDPDQLPVLQHALMRMWDAWSAGGDRDRPIDFRDFEATGGLGAALSNHADEIYESLPSNEHRAACEKIFKTLTEKGDDNRGIRRPTRLAQLQAIAGSDHDTVTAVLDAYRGHGVTFLMPGTEVALTDRTVIDLSHESLMRGWQRLRMWVEDEAQSARIFRRLLDTARLWSDGKAGLFRDPDLQIALSWREQEAPNADWADQYGGDFGAAIAFLETSHAAVEAEGQAQEAARQRELEQARQLAEAQQLRLEQQQRAARRLRMVIAGLAAVAVLAGVACVLALLANQRATRLAAVARQNEEKARQSERQARDYAQSAQQSQKETARALAVVESQKAKAETAERLARAAEETGRKLLYTTDMRLAPFVWRDDRTTAEQLRVLLAKHIPERGPRIPAKSDLRGFEWHYYDHLLRDSAAVFAGHAEQVVDGAFSVSGPLVTLDSSGQLRRWDLTSQAEDEASRRDLPGGAHASLRVLSPNGRLAALVNENKVHVFDTSSGEETYQIDSASVYHRRLVFSGNTERLVIVDDKVRWLSAASGELIASVDQKFDRVESLALSADGLTLAVVGHGSTGHFSSVFRLNAAARAATPLAKDFGGVGTMGASAMSPDGGRIAVGASLDGTLAIFDAATGRRIGYHWSAHASPITAMAFSGDGARLATADVEGTIKIWAVPLKLNSKSTAILTLKGHQGVIHRARFSSDGKRLITTSADRTARVWDLQNAGAAIRPVERVSRTAVVRFSPDGQLIAAASGTSLRLWDAATGRLVRELSNGGKGRVSSVAFSPTDHRLLAVGYGGAADVSYVALWDIDAGTELARLPGATDLPDFRMDEYRGDVGALRFSPDGKYLVAGFGARYMYMPERFSTPLKVWEVAPRRLVRRLQGHMNFCVSLDFSADGTLLASGSRDGTAILWSTANWKATRTLENPDQDEAHRHGGLGMVEDVAFSPDGKALAMASRAANVHLWDVATGRLLETLEGHSSAVHVVAFSPDGRTLASGSTDQTVRLWNVETRRELMQLDPGGVEVGEVVSLAFSTDGRQLLAGGDGAAFWSTAPIVWNDPDRAADRLRSLLKSNADFASRIRMLSENLRLHEALAKLDPKDRRVQAALAATQANWHASRQAWPEAVAAIDRLMAVDPSGPGTWLRTPGLLRLATALLHQNRPAVAATLLQGGAKRRGQDGLPPVFEHVALGFAYSTQNETARVTELSSGFSGSLAGVAPGDIIVKVNDTEMTTDSLAKLGGLLAGEAGTKVRLTVRHAGSNKQEVVELTRERFVRDSSTGELLYPLRAAIDERLAKQPRDAGLLELRAELAGQWSDAGAQVADYTAAIEALARVKPEPMADLRRLYGRRGDAHIRLEQWPEAVADFDHAVTRETTDETLLSDQALALAESILQSENWTILRPTAMKSEGGATLTLQPDGSILASGTNPDNDVYTIEAECPGRVGAIRLEAIPDRSMPGGGSGRAPAWENFILTDFRVMAGGTAITWSRADADFSQEMRMGRPARFPIASAVDSDPSTGWAIGPQVAVRHWAVFTPSQPITQAQAGKGRLTLRLAFGHKEMRKYNLGRFRLSVSENADSFERQSRLFAITKLSDPWQKLAAAYQLRGDQPAIDHLVERRPKLAGPIGDLFTQGKDEEKDWKRAIALYSKGITEKTTDVDLLSKRARAHEAVENWEAAAADWSRAAAENPDGARLLGGFARRLAAANQAALARAPFEKAQALYEQSLRADPGNDVVAAELAELLLSRKSPWHVLRPAEMKSAAGATLTLEPDDSVFVSGNLQPRETYTLDFHEVPRNIKAICLEALRDNRLPYGGPGTHGSGNFVLSDLTVWRWGKTDPRALTPIPLRAIFATFEERRAETSLTRGESGWSVYGATGKSHRAVFAVEPDTGGPDSSWLRVVLDFYADNDIPATALLGRFRFSVSSDDPTAIVREDGKRWDAMKISDPWAKLGAAYAVAGDIPQAADLLAKSGEASSIAAWLEGGLLIDEVLDSTQARHPEAFANLLQHAASAAAERGQIDHARALNARLVKLQPQNGLWKERAEQLRPGVLGVWNFDDGLGPWGDINQCALSVKDGVLTARMTGDDPYFSTPISAPAGGKAIVLRYRSDRALTMQLYWSDTSGGLDDLRHGDYPLQAAAGAWREAIIPFSSQGVLNLLRLDPNTAPDHPLEVDSIVLRELEPGDIASLPADNALLTRLAAASEAAGRTREALLFLAKASTANPNDTPLSLKVAALQAWFGQEKELAATRQRVLAFAKVDKEDTTPERAARVCGVRPSTDRAELDAALELIRAAVKLKKGGESWNLLALGVLEYRSGNHAAAEKTLLAAAEAVKTNEYASPIVPPEASFFRAMSLFQQGKRDEARQLAIATAAKMKPLPADDQNPLTGTASPDFLYVWLAYKEAKALIHFDAAAAASTRPSGK